MAHIDLGVDENQFPGINGPFRFRPETAKPLSELAEVLLRVLIAAAFCMYNRYVDGLGTLAPADPRAYAEAARRIVEQGYLT